MRPPMPIGRMYATDRFHSWSDSLDISVSAVIVFNRAMKSWTILFFTTVSATKGTEVESGSAVKIVHFVTLL